MFEGYGHQDLLIGRCAHRDVFPHVVGFLDEFSASGSRRVDPDVPPHVEWPWMGPTIGRVTRTDEALVLRLAVRPPPARAHLLGIVLVPAHRASTGWRFDVDTAVVAETLDEQQREALTVALNPARVPQFDGFAVLTVHDRLPVPRKRRLSAVDKGEGLFLQPADRIAADLQPIVAGHLARAVDDRELAVVELDPAWIAAADRPDVPVPAGALCIAVASGQHPPGLVDRAPAQRSWERLAATIAHGDRASRPQALLLMGDQVQVDAAGGLFDPGSDGRELSRGAAAQAYRLNFASRAFRRVAKAVPTYPTLGAHEVVGGWEPGSVLPLIESKGLEAYRSHQHKLVDSRRQGPFDYTLAIAGHPVYVFDDRSARQARSLRRTHPSATSLRRIDDASIHGPDGLIDLLRWLDGQPPDAPKLIVSSTPVLPVPRTAAGGTVAERVGLDDWSGYPASQHALLAHLRDRGIRHVVLLAGHRHLSSVSSVWLDTAAGPESLEVVSIASSGLYAPWPFVNPRRDELWLDGRVDLPPPPSGGLPIGAAVRTAALGESHGFAIVSLAGAAGDWILRVRLDLEGGAITVERRLGDTADTAWKATS